MVTVSYVSDFIFHIIDFFGSIIYHVLLGEFLGQWEDLMWEK